MGKEVIEEQKRAADPDYARKKAEERHKQTLEKEEKAAEKEGREMPKGTEMPKGRQYMNDTLETVEMKEAKKRKGNPDAFGWDVFNQDSLYRAHEKRLKHLEFDEKAYNEQKEQQDDT